jgi:hypothetical protein
MRILISFCCLLLFLLPFGSTIAQGELLVTEVEQQYQFAKNLTIHAVIEDPNSIQKLIMIIRPNGQSSRQVIVTPTSDGRIEIDYNLETDTIEPFNRVFYWFEAELNNGTILSSPSYWFDYVDNRFTWKSNESKLFNIYWVEGDNAFGQKLQDIARDGLERATQLLPVVPELPIIVYVYPDYGSVQSALSLSDQSWVSGHTSENMGVILVEKSLPLSDFTDLERQIPHEIMHILHYQSLGVSYANAPAWLLEGLATETELYPNPDAQRALEVALTNNTIVPISNLCQGFSKDAEEAQLNYAQSASLVKYIREKYGVIVFPEFLDNAKTGVSCGQNVESVLGISSEQLEQNWHQTLLPQDQQNPIDTKLLFLVLIPVTTIIIGIFVLLRIKRSRINLDSK